MTRDPFGANRRFIEAGGRERTLNLLDHLATTDGKPVDFKTSYTVEPEQIIANVRSSIRRQLPQCYPMVQPDPQKPVMLLCGGPSLGDHEQEIVEKRRAGTKAFTVNGTYRWALDRGLGPLNLIMADGRPECADFIHEARQDCVYFIASQCAPAVFDKLVGYPTAIWHCVSFPEKEVPILNDYYWGSGCWAPVMGMSTVATRAVMLLAMLGFERIEIFGLDSCYRGDQHHAYPQALNDGSPVGRVRCAGREFLCAPWMIGQAANFLEMMYGVLQQARVELLVHGDGLIAHLIEVGANLPDEERGAA